LLKDYVKTNRYTIVSPSDFWSLANDHTQADLTPIITEYFSHAKTP